MVKEGGCELFHQDDEYFEVDERKTNLKDEDGCTGCDMMIKHLKKFGKDFGKEFGKEVEEMKNNIDNITKNMKLLVVVVLCCWFYFLLGLGTM